MTTKIDILREQAKKLGAELIISDNAFIDENHLDCFWYNGLIALLKYKGFTITINVNGNSDNVNTFALSVIKDDATLHECRVKGLVSWSDKWVEYAIFDKDNDELTSHLDDDVLLGNNVYNAVNNIEYYIEQIEERIFVHKKPKKYIVLVDDSYVRDAQVFNPQNTSVDEFIFLDIHDSDEWRDACRPLFVGIFEAKNEADAIRQASEKEGFFPNTMFCIKV